MKTVTYDPINGEAIPDGKAKSFAKDLPETCTISSISVIDEIRLAVLKGELNQEDITFMFNGEPIIFKGVDGMFSEYPEGFGDHACLRARETISVRCDKIRIRCDKRREK